MGFEHLALPHEMMGQVESANCDTRVSHLFSYILIIFIFVTIVKRLSQAVISILSSDLYFCVVPNVACNVLNITEN
jgi:hypothetical protein